ncbi:hypothetical protein CSB93_6517 (plasmid) [Pseudomonas paraeruginosa]|uniref:Uncharacterized protein n=1 Tax=Pseudomonas paraeruginosa TaxID=2994495 RepID=A0A2R3J513_9PSED|nr:hypothetical protein CSB93_6517 [Pseudomonas paraeruginosa]AWE95559.1 hypothetical protein CSC28_6922 [Pseudomonas paraeruginosa]
MLRIEQHDSGRYAPGDNADVRRTATELEAEIRTWALLLGVENPSTDD